MINLPSTLGKAFIVSALAPMFVFVLLNVTFVPGNILPLISLLTMPSASPILKVLGIELSDITLLLIPSVFAILLNALNTPIIRLFEGAYGFQRNFLLKWMLERNKQKHESLYGDLLAYQKQLQKSDDELERQGLRREINQTYERLYTGLDGDGFSLPVDRRRLMPTRFGNIWGVIEEYPSLRYGMDGMTLWPRMVSVIGKEYSELLADSKMTMDALLNASLLAIIFGIEMAAVSITQATMLNVTLVVGSFVAAYLLYQTAVTTLLEMGELIKSCFDVHRGALLSRFGLSLPVGDITDERQVWSRLTRYILAGDADDYPALPPKI